jgi:hypothetical protein
MGADEIVRHARAILGGDTVANGDVAPEVRLKTNNNLPSVGAVEVNAVHFRGYLFGLSTNQSLMTSAAENFWGISSNAGTSFQSLWNAFVRLLQTPLIIRLRD